MASVPDPELVERPRRRSFTAEYKLRVLRETDACTRPGEIGALLRREGLYTSHLSAWRKQRDQGALHALSKPRGRPKADPRDAQIERLRSRAERAEAELAKARKVIEVQGNVSALLEELLQSGGAQGDGSRAMIEQAVEDLTPLVGTRPACRALGVAPATIYRRRRPPPRPQPSKPRPKPARALSPTERQEVLEVLHSERFVDCSPAQVWATLLDEGRYLASERTMYRILTAQGESRERRNQLVHPPYTKPQLLAERPNELWSWDITKLLGPAKWTYYYLYVILDVFSRYVVGWTIQHAESAQVAQQLIAQAVTQQGITPGQLTIHADRGSSMRSKPVAFLLADLGVTKTHSRPYTSTDNPYSEAQFKTLKYRPGFPNRFDSMVHARHVSRSFFDWYNHRHRHSGIGLMAPATVHYGRAEEAREARARVLAAAHAANPERFVQGLPQPPKLPTAAWINPPTPQEDAH
ncbi:MAG: IS3 family transposase [Candidatus Methylomirabilia bacterium]